MPRDRVFSKCHQRLMERFTMSDTEEISHGYMEEFNSLVRSEDRVFDFLSKRELRGLKIESPEGDNWTTFNNADQLFVAIAILDAEASGMLERVGGIQ